MEKYVLKRDEAVLFVVDIQDRLVPAMKYGDKVILNTNRIISFAKNLGIPIIITEQYPKGLGKTVSDVSNNLEELLTYEKITFSGCTSRKHWGRFLLLFSIPLDIIILR